MEMLSPLKAIRAKCLDCVADKPSEVRLCPSENCPLWPYRMGHNPNRKGIGGFKEKDLADELIEKFDYHHINKSPSVFDMVKLKWMNGEYIKNMEFERFKEMALPYVKEVITRDVKIDAILELVKSRIEVFPDIKDHIDFFEELPDYDVEMYTHKKMKTNTENSLEILREEYEVLKGVEDWSFDNLHDTLMEYIAKKEIKNGTGLWPVRTAVSGKQMTPGGAFEILDILGKEESLRRMEIGIQKLEVANA
mgnify:CR=1 FL=1